MRLRVVWLSANLFGYELLKEALNVKEANVVAVLTLSEKAKTKMYDGIDRNKWHEFGLPVYEIEDINREVALLESLHPDIVMMCGWRQILSKNVLNVPRLSVIGFHPTLLPKGRGPAPIINTILKGFKESGVTMFYLAEGIDNGEIIGHANFGVKDDDYSIDVYNKVIEAGKTLVKRYLPLLAKSRAPRVPQNEAEATYLEKRSLKDNEIKLETKLPEEIYRKIRAFSRPYKGAYIRLGNKKLIIWRAELRDINEQ